MKHIMKIFGVLMLILLTISCKQKEEINVAEMVINKAITHAGGKVLDNATIAFDFRKKHYKAKRENGNFALTRCSDATCNDTLDVLTNSGFERRINNKRVKLPDSLINKYSNSVNSVHYFSVLPYGLDSPAVKKEVLDTVRIKDDSYYEIKVIFEQRGGGKDYEDEYMYWVNTEDFTVDYLAYNYHVNEGGTRFREAYNVREINGVRVVDYKNYKPATQYPALESLDSLFLNGQLELISHIELKNVEVKACPNC
jgi:uncharacterized protein YajQ (UPF0234 family)